MSESMLPLASPGRSARVLWALARPRWPYMALVGLAGVLAGLAGLVAPWVIGVLVDRLREAPVMSDVYAGAAIVVMAGVVGAVSSWLGQSWLGRLAEPTVAGLRAAVMDRALALESSRVERAGTGDLVSRVAEDSREISRSTSTILPLFVQSLFTVVVSAAGLVAVDWRLGLVGLSAIPMYWLTLRWYLPRSGPFYRREREAFGRRAGRLLGGIGGAETLRAYQAQDTELRRIDAASAEARDLSIGVFRFLTQAFTRNNRAEAVVLGLLLATGFVLVYFDQASAGTVATAALVFHRLFNPIGAVVGLFDQIQSAGASLTRMVGVMNIPISGRNARPAEGELRLSGVGHSYVEGSPVIGGIDLTIAPGQVVAIVGATGAGKSTLAQIAAGVIEPSEGQVTLGGVNLAELDHAALRERVCMVSQEVHSFATDVYENVSVPRPLADEAEVRRALDTLGASWVAGLPSAGHTEVGEGGHRLTPMQDQMLALARLELADPAFVVLDEATAEAGSAGARELESAAARVLERRGGLLVIHRLAQAAVADRILVMEDGAVVEDGRHEDLLASEGRYARLWHAWKGR